MPMMFETTADDAEILERVLVSHLPEVARAFRMYPRVFETMPIEVSRPLCRWLWEQLFPIAHAIPSGRDWLALHHFVKDLLRFTGEPWLQGEQVINQVLAKRSA